MSVNPTQRLYWIAGVLAAIRFILVPWWLWLGESRQTLEVLTKRLDRSVGVIEHRQEIERSAADLRSVLKVLHERFPEAKSVEEFKLSSQQKISAILNESSLRADVFDWVVDRFDDPPRVARVRARIQVAGTVQSLAVLQARLETSMPNLVIRDVRIEPRNPTKAPSSTAASLSLMADLYFREPGRR